MSRLRIFLDRARELRMTLREDLRLRAIPSGSASDRRHPVPTGQETPLPHRPEDPYRCDLSLCSAYRRGAPLRYRRQRPPQQCTSRKERRLEKQLTGIPLDPACPGAHLQRIQCPEKRVSRTGPPAPHQRWRVGLPRRSLAAIHACGACPTKLRRRIRVQCQLGAPNADIVLLLLARFVRFARRLLRSQATWERSNRYAGQMSKETAPV